MITLNNLSMNYGAKLLFDKVNLNLTSKRRYGIVGANGTGKTTFLKLLMGAEEPTLGEVSIPKVAKIGWMKQDQFRYENEAILNVVLRGNEELWHIFEKREKLLNTTEWTEEIGLQLAEIEEEIARLDGYAAEAFAETLLKGLGIAREFHLQPLSTLSGGYKLRVLMAQTFFNNPDILLLDEPTNHLDIHSIAWLEKYLKKEFKGLVIFISHDQSFLDQLSTHILDFDFGTITQYTGNFSSFLKQKKLTIEQKENERDNLEARIKEMQNFVDRFKAKATKAKQAQSRIKMIEKIELPDLLHSSRKAPAFEFIQKRPSGKNVLKVTGLSKNFEEKKLFQKVTFDLFKGEKLAIIGENGIGKSTLLKCITGQLAPDNGEVEWGHEAHFSYFAQDHHEKLREKQSAFEWLAREAPDYNDTEIRRMLGRMLFPKEDADKNILSLSGGEAARLLLGAIMLEKRNILILDEPTNHLDLESVEALGRALKKFPGTLITVSHNRHFMELFATSILSLSHEKNIYHRGGYKNYIRKYGDIAL